MAKIPEENTPKAWHRYFGIECNNLGWNLSVATRSPDQDQQLLDIAHASSLHWNEVGTEQNGMRATMLLAEGILAHAAKLCGRDQLHKDMYSQANATLAKIKSQEDREIVEATFAHVPAP
jgi:hypothetical protein